MESDGTLSFEIKKRMNTWFTSKDGKVFVELLEDMHNGHLACAETISMVSSASCNEQVSAQVCQAVGVNEVLNFIKTIDMEVKEAKKREEQAKE